MARYYQHYASKPLVNLVYSHSRHFTRLSNPHNSLLSSFESEEIKRSRSFSFVCFLSFFLTTRTRFSFFSLKTFSKIPRRILLSHTNKTLKSLHTKSNSTGLSLPELLVFCFCFVWFSSGRMLGAASALSGRIRAALGRFTRPGRRGSGRRWWRRQRRCASVAPTAPR